VDSQHKYMNVHRFSYCYAWLACSTAQCRLIRTHDLNRRGAADLRLRTRGHWDRQYS